MIPAPAAVIFDYDGTLVDTAPVFVDSINRALGRAGLRAATRREISSRDLRSIIADRLPETASVSTENVFNSIWEIFAEALASPFPLRDGVTHTLRTLHDQGISLAIISKRGGKAGSLPLIELRSNGIEQLFRYVRVGVGVEEYPQVISDTVQRIKTTMNQTILVSDWCWDIKQAKLCGLRAIGVLGGVSDEDEHQDAGADWIVKQLRELPTLIESQRQRV